jgi:diadenylate cyclase
VIINGDRVLAAGCLLPLSTNPAVSLSLGTRHRAAIGMSEDSDALVLVVSEEDGSISLARSGVLKRGVEPAEVLTTLRKLPA